MLSAGEIFEVGAWPARSVLELKALAETRGMDVRPLAVTPARNHCTLRRGGKLEFRGPDLIVGTPIDPSCLNGVHSKTAHLPDVVLVELGPARIIGWRALELDDGIYINSAIPWGEERLNRAWRDNRSGFDGFAIKEVDGAAFLITKDRSKARGPLGRAFVLHALEPGNYGSFIVRMLPTLLLLPSIRTRFDYLVVPDRATWLMQMLWLIGMRDLRVYTQRELYGVTLDSAITIEEFVVEGLFDRDTASVVSGIGAKNFRSDLPKRIYASRRINSINRPGYRPLTNEDEIEAYLTKRGFQIIHPESLQLSEQIALFGSAEVVVGPSGSGMLNAAFSPAGTFVLEMESFTTNVRQHGHVYGAGRRRYGFMFGNIDEGTSPLSRRPWNVPVARLAEAVERLLDEGAS